MFILLRLWQYFLCLRLLVGLDTIRLFSSLLFLDMRLFNFLLFLDFLLYSFGYINRNLHKNYFGVYTRYFFFL